MFSVKLRPPQPLPAGRGGTNGGWLPRAAARRLALPWATEMSSLQDFSLRWRVGFMSCDMFEDGLRGGRGLRRQ